MTKVKKASSTKNKSPEKKSVVRGKKPEEYSQVIREGVPTKNPLASFMVMPKGLTLEIQDEEEEILLLVRRHVITNVKWVLIALLMFLAPAFFGWFPFYFLLPERFQFMTELLWYLLTTAVVLEGFFNWYFDVFIVTDERIIDVDFRNLIYKNITTTKIEKVEDVTHNISGAIPSFLDYGNILIQTAGSGVALIPQDTMPVMEIYNTPHPAKVARLINELILEEEQEKIEGRVR